MKIWLTGLFVIYAFGTSAQILKVNKGFLAADSSDYFTGVVDATFAINNRSSTAEQQNVYIGVNNNVDVMYIAPKGATLLISGINYFKIGDGPLIYNGSIHLRHIFNRAATLTPEIYTQAQFDESRNMTSRGLLGGGYRWNILQKKNVLYLGVGGFYEDEQWQGEQSTIPKRLFKFNTYLSADVSLTSTTSINTVVYFQSGRDAAIEAFRNRLSGHLEIKNAVTSRLKLKMSSNFLWDDRPIIPLNEFIYEVFFGLEYSFN